MLLARIPTARPNDGSGNLPLVEMTGLEPAASCSQSMHATNCVTSRQPNRLRWLVYHNLVALSRVNLRNTFSIGVFPKLTEFILPGGLRRNIQPKPITSHGNLISRISMKIQNTITHIHLYDLENIKLQIVSFRYVPQNGMIGRLLTRFDLSEAHTCVVRRIVEHPAEHTVPHEV